MICDDCDGEGVFANGKRCFCCNGNGNLCDECGDPCEAGLDICDECMRESAEEDAILDEDTEDDLR